MPNRRRSDTAQEQTVDLKSRRGARQGAELLPHERDQNPAVIDKAAVPDPNVRQAAKDLEAGLQDTDRRADAAEHFERAHGADAQTGLAQDERTKTGRSRTERARIERLQNESAQIPSPAPQRRR